jgi:hypothetical protein
MAPDSSSKTILFTKAGAILLTKEVAAIVLLDCALMEAEQMRKPRRKMFFI